MFSDRLPRRFLVGFFRAVLRRLGITKVGMVRKSLIFWYSTAILSPKDLLTG